MHAVDVLTRCALVAKDGDRLALDQLVEGTYEQVWRLCSRLVDEQSADDLAQDAFVRAIRALPSFRGEASAQTWLLTIARNACMDELRMRARQRRRDASLAASNSVSTLVKDDIGQEIGVADDLACLAPERREAFVLTQLLGLSYREAAIICSCPPGTVRSHVARARADLLEAFERERRDRSTSEGACADVTRTYPITGT